MDTIDEIKAAYRHVFKTPVGGTVLADLAEYCNFVATTTGMPHEEAKRDVFLHILEMYGDPDITDIAVALQNIPNRNKEMQDETDK